jgi:hypothetical protein
MAIELNSNWPERFRNLNWNALRGSVIAAGIVALIGLLALLITWRTFFKFVPPGQHLVITSNYGQPREPGSILAEAGQKGVLREVLGEGWHFVMPVLYESVLATNTEIPAGKVGIVIAAGGKPLPSGKLLAESDDQKGIQQRILTPGNYRINKSGYTVEIVDAVEIKPGYVGVQRKRMSRGGSDQPEANALLPNVLQPGMYYVNPYELEVVPMEVGIFQSTFHYDEKKEFNTAISFTCKGGFPISVDCTIEWEILPSDMPKLLVEYGRRSKIEEKVIEVQAHSIGRDLGTNNSIQDFIAGTTREQFQMDFTNRLTQVCKRKHVVVHSAFIRNIVIPESYLKPIREKQISAETEITNRARESTAESLAAVERAERMVKQREAEVAAETERLVGSIQREAENVQKNVAAEIDKMDAEYGAKIAIIDAERNELLGSAEADARKLVETAKADLYRMKLAVFNNDGEAFLRYNLAENLRGDLMIRLFHSGEGTFWTNMEGKGMNTLLPLGALNSPVKKEPATTTKEK